MNRDTQTYCFTVDSERSSLATKGTPYKYCRTENRKRISDTNATLAMHLKVNAQLTAAELAGTEQDFHYELNQFDVIKQIGSGAFGKV